LAQSVLFVCVENAARSLIAEAVFNADPPPGWVATSAGTAPASTPNSRTGPMLREIGLDLPAHPPRHLTRAEMDRAAVLITMGCLDSESCPARLKELPVTDWALEDPARLDDDGFRRVRDEIRARVAALRSELYQRSAETRERGA
jgi:arsenate reductase